MRSSSTRSGRIAAEQLERLGAVAGELRLVALGREHDADHLGDGGVIVDNQDARVHRLAFLRPTVVECENMNVRSARLLIRSES